MISLRGCRVAWLMTLLILAGCSTLPRDYHPSNPVDPVEFSHQRFDELMHAYVEDGVVNYPGLQSNPQLEAYIEEINRLDPTTLPSKKDRLAFWINAYNAFAIKGILDGYSPTTLAGQYSYFISRDYMVGEEDVNLWSIERDILIPRFREPLIHFAIVCASRSCPKLRSFAYLPEQLDQQLDDSARGFINDPTRNRFDRSERIAYLSMIFEWFEEDFVMHSGSLTKYVKQYVDDPDLARELESETYTVKFLEYDWSLNGVPPVEQASAPQGMKGLFARKTDDRSGKGN